MNRQYLINPGRFTDIYSDFPVNGRILRLRGTPHVNRKSGYTAFTFSVQQLGVPETPPPTAKDLPAHVRHLCSRHVPAQKLYTWGWEPQASMCLNPTPTQGWGVGGFTHEMLFSREEFIGTSTEGVKFYGTYNFEVVDNVHGEKHFQSEMQDLMEIVGGNGRLPVKTPDLSRVISITMEILGQDEERPRIYVPYVNDGKTQSFASFVQLQPNPGLGIPPPINSNNPPSLASLMTGPLRVVRAYLTHKVAQNLLWTQPTNDPDTFEYVDKKVALVATCVPLPARRCAEADSPDYKGGIWF